MQAALGGHVPFETHNNTAPVSSQHVSSSAPKASQSSQQGQAGTSVAMASTSRSKLPVKSKKKKKLFVDLNEP